MENTIVNSILWFLSPSCGLLGVFLIMQCLYPSSVLSSESTRTLIYPLVCWAELLR